MPNWFHVACFFKKNAISSQGDVGGFDGLRWDDQQTLKQRIAGGGGAVGGSVEAPTGKMADKVHVRADLEVEYAKSGRAKCRGCFESIAQVHVLQYLLSSLWSLSLTLALCIALWLCE